MYQKVRLLYYTDIQHISYQTGCVGCHSKRVSLFVILKEPPCWSSLCWWKVTSSDIEVSYYFKFAISLLNRGKTPQILNYHSPQVCHFYWYRRILLPVVVFSHDVRGSPQILNYPTLQVCPFLWCRRISTEIELPDLPCLSFIVM